MEADSGIILKELRVDGGATANDALMQFQSDILGVPVIRPTVTETTALGAAYLAGLGTGYWTSVEDIQKQWEVDRRFDPAKQAGEAEALLKGWPQAWKEAKTGAVGA